jgi:hypothetical protein
VIHQKVCPGIGEVTMADQDVLLLGVDEDTVVTRRESAGDNDGSDRTSDFV